MRKLIRRLIPGTPSDEVWDVSSSTAILSPAEIAAYVADWMRRAGENPEGVGYAGFSIDERPCGVEIYCAPRHRFYANIEIDRRVVGGEIDTVRRVLGDVVPPDNIEDIGDYWSVRFYTPEVFPDTILLVLRDLCRVPEGQQLAIDEWWT